MDLSAAEARRLALGAQGLVKRREPGGVAGLSAVRRVCEQLNVVQIDSVNVLARAHYLPLFARLGPYKSSDLDRLVYSKRELFEYPGHAAALMTVDHQPLMRWRMEQHRVTSWEPTRAYIENNRPGYVDAVLGEVKSRGPLAFTELADAGREAKQPTKYAESSTAWWNWSVGKEVMVHLAISGELAVAERKGFEPRYDLLGQVIPPEILAAPTPSVEDAHRELVRRAVKAVGVGATKEIADYYRLPVASTKLRLAELCESGSVVRGRVEGWKDPAFVDAAAKTPRRCEAHALVSPFDSLIWERKRTKRVFDFTVSFEIYVPPAKRIYGYYVLAFLMGDRFAARVDLKADRTRKVLLVPGAFLEPDSDAGEVATALAIQLQEMARWLGLDDIEVGGRGDLAKPLAKALR